MDVRRFGKGGLSHGLGRSEEAQMRFPKGQNAVFFNSSNVTFIDRRRDIDSTFNAIAEVMFSYVAVAGILIAAAEVFTLIVLKKVKLPFPTKCFSMNFLVSDILFHSVALSYSLIKNSSDVDPVTIKLARQFTEGVATCLSFSAVTVMSCDRVVALMWPLHYKAFMNGRKVLVVIAAAWTFNFMSYLTSVGMFLHAYYEAGWNRRSAHTKGNGIRGVAELVPLREILAKTEHITLVCILTSNEVLNFTACCCLTYLIYSHMQRQKARRQFLDGVKQRESANCERHLSTLSDRTSSNPKERNASTSTVEECVDLSNDTNAGVDCTLGERIASESCYGNNDAMANNVPCRGRQRQTSVFSIESNAIERNNRTGLDKSTHTNEPVNRDSRNRQKSSNIVVTKVILTVALIQFFFHLPYIVSNFLKLSSLYLDKNALGAFLEMTSRCLLQIGTVPSLYLFILKLKKCRETIQQMLCCCRK